MSSSIRPRTSRENRLSKYASLSPSPFFQLTLEVQKLISGRYLGEILRLVIRKLIEKGVLLLGQNTYKLEKPYCFDTAFLSLMERYAFSISLTAYKIILTQLR